MARPVRPADPLRLDRRALRRHFERASRSFDAHAVLASRVREELLSRLDLVAFEPRVVLDLGCGTGHAARALKRRWPKARVLALDLSPSMLAQAAAQSSLFRRFGRACADAVALPIAGGAVDLVFSSLMLPWVDALDVALAEARRVLSARGYFTFATLGPDTLQELRAAWAAADDGAHVHRFLDMHDVGDAVARSGLAEPVLDADRIELAYPDTLALMRDLKAIGAHNVTAGRPRTLLGAARLRRMSEAYEAFRRGDALPATYEVIYGASWGAAGRPAAAAHEGEVLIAPGSIRQSGARR